MLPNIHEYIINGSRITVHSLGPDHSLRHIQLPHDTFVPDGLYVLFDDQPMHLIKKVKTTTFIDELVVQVGDVYIISFFDEILMAGPNNEINPLEHAVTSLYVRSDDLLNYDPNLPASPNILQSFQFAYDTFAPQYLHPAIF